MHKHTTGDTNNRKKTLAPISAGASADSEFIRITDVEKLFGIKRGLTYRWLKEGLIKGACIRKKGATTGIRLIHTESVREFLYSHLSCNNLSTTPNQYSGGIK